MDSNCEQGNVLGHDTAQSLEEGVFPLSPPGWQPTIISVGFSPDW